MKHKIVKSTYKTYFLVNILYKPIVVGQSKQEKIE